LSASAQSDPTLQNLSVLDNDFDTWSCLEKMSDKVDSSLELFPFGLEVYFQKIMNVLGDLMTNLVMPVVAHVDQENKEEFLDVKFLLDILNKIINTHASFSMSFQIECSLRSLEALSPRPNPAITSDIAILSRMSSVLYSPRPFCSKPSAKS
jgi:hypothetical protein